MSDPERPTPTSVAVDWAPYSVGHWAYIRPWGWTWVDAAPWGFAPFHYGRWVHVGGPHGWGWIPGRRYAGAWVVWRTGPAGYGYVGWAPAPPLFYWRFGVAVAYVGASYPYGWSYCHVNDVYHALQDLEAYLKMARLTEQDEEQRKETEQVWEHVKTLRRRAAQMN